MSVAKIIVEDDEPELKEEDIILHSDTMVKGVCMLDSWFVRASWPNKKKFLFRGLHLLTREELETIVLLLGPPSKDYYYSASGCTNTLDDIIPLDDNRQMIKETLDKAMESDLKWLSSVPKTQVAYILIGLTELGGSALRVTVYEKSISILNELSDFDVTPRIPKSSRKIGSKEEETLTDLNKDCQEYRDFKKHLTEYDEFINKLKKKLVKSERSEKKSVGKKKSDSSVIMSGASQDSVDFVQLLPSWINRRIFFYLDEETLSKCQKVNPYWKNAIKKLHSEHQARKNLVSAMSELEINPEEINEGKKKSRNRDKKKKRSPHRKTTLASPVDDQLGAGRLTVVSCENLERLEMLDAFASAKNRQVFRKKHLLLWTLYEYTEGKVMAVGKKWIAMSKSNNIQLCNLISFSIMPGIMKGHTEKIISLAFHPEDGQMISAAMDSTLRRWDVWSRKEIYMISIASIKKVASNETYYVAAGIDIRVFCWDQNTCLWTLELDDGCVANSLFLSTDNVIFAGFPNGIVKIMTAKTGCQISEIPPHYESNMTCIYPYGVYLVTANEAGCVYLWHTDTPEPLMLAKISFSITVKTALLHEGCVLAATDDGKLNIWDIADNLIVQSTVVNEDSMPITSIHLLNYDDHCKIILNSELGIKVFQFDYIKKRRNIEKFIKPQVRRIITAGPDSCACKNLIKMRENRKDRESRIKEGLLKRHSCHPNLRKDLETILTIQESTRYLRNELGNLCYFPRLEMKSHSARASSLKQSAEKNEDSNIILQKQPMKMKALQESYKNLLQIHNPYKQIL